MKIFSFLLLFFSNFIFAQNIKLEGLVLDNTKSGLEMANVMAVNQANKAMDAYAITNDKGKFALNLKPNTTYIIKVSYLGMQNKEITIVTKTENVLLFIAAGMLYMFVKAPPKWSTNKAMPIVLLGINLGQIEWGILGKIALFFGKAGAFVFGSGLAIVPFLHNGVVIENQWLTEHQFVDAVAVAMITPGPVVITVGFIGYLVADFPGALVAALATFLPCYLFTILPAPYFKKIAKNKSVKAFVDGITAAVVGALAGAVIIIGLKSIVDIPTGLIAALAIFSLIYIRKIKEPYVILIAAILGFVIKTYL